MGKNVLTYQNLRDFVKITEAFILLLIPFIKINGKPFLLFDVETLKLYIAGKVYFINEFYLPLLFILIFLFIFLLITVVQGRIWCGWFCPQSVLSDIIKRISRKNQFIANLIEIILSALVSANIICYFVLPEKFIQLVLSLSVTFWFFISITFFIYLFIAKFQFDFCAGYCPYAKFQEVLFDNATLTIAYNEKRGIDDCIDDKKCVKVCPVKIDIRKGSQIECIQCAMCIDACSNVMGKFNKKTLVDYFRKTDRRFTNTKALFLFLSAVIIISVTAISLMIRQPFNITITNIEQISDGKDKVRLFLTLENREEAEQIIKINLLNSSIIEDSLEVILSSYEIKRITIIITPEKDFKKITLEIKSNKMKGKIDKEVLF